MWALRAMVYGVTHDRPETIALDRGIRRPKPLLTLDHGSHETRASAGTLTNIQDQRSPRPLLLEPKTRMSVTIGWVDCVGRRFAHPADVRRTTALDAVRGGW